jgi:photosystem I reaction center subunit XII
MLTDTQVFLALFIAMIAGLLAIQLGTSLYN